MYSIKFKVPDPETYKKVLEKANELGYNLIGQIPKIAGLSLDEVKHRLHLYNRFMFLFKSTKDEYFICGTNNITEYLVLNTYVEIDVEEFLNSIDIVKRYKFL